MPKLINNNKFEIASEKDPIVHSNTSLRRNTQGPNPGTQGPNPGMCIIILLNYNKRKCFSIYSPIYK